MIRDESAEAGDFPPPVRSADRQARRGPRRGRKISTIVMASLAVVLAVVVAGGSVAIYLKYRAAWNGISRVDVSGDLRPQNRPPADPNAENILLIGGSWGGSTGADVAGPSDTVIVVHIAPGAHNIVALSFPRDSVVPILHCTAENGTPGQAARPSYDIEQINATFGYGGPGCLWETIEQTTGIHINDFIELSFTGFEQVINDLGGVNVCLPQAVNDSVSGLDLSAGEHRIYGVQALEFWRTRENLGMGTDPQRIQRDQFLMAALFQGIEQSGLLSSPTKMLSVIDTLTSHSYVTTDTGLTPSVLLKLGEALHGIHGDSVQFVTVPWTTYTGDAQWINSAETQSYGNVNWVQWQQPQANALFTAIAHDTKLPKTSSSPAPSPTPAVIPADVPVQVLNGTTTQGLATTTATNLRQRGFDVVGTPADAPTRSYTKSVIEYKSAAQLPAAQTLAQLFGDVTLQPDPSLRSTTLNLILGSTFTALKPASSASQGISSVAATYGGITANVNICNDSAAFSGPNGG
jgi:LCP family protein required for cell wall assembly